MAFATCVQPVMVAATEVIAESRVGVPRTVGTVYRTYGTVGTVPL